MTLAEKLGQLQQLDGEADGRSRPEHLALAARGLLGSVLNVRGAANVNPLQKAAVEGSRLKIPLLFGYDVDPRLPHHLPDPARRGGELRPGARRSAPRMRPPTRRPRPACTWTFAPMVDVARDPRWGRIVEGAGEDPYLGSVLAAARVRGFQGDGPRSADRGRGHRQALRRRTAPPRAGRDYNTVDVSERTLREVYLPPFQAAVERAWRRSWPRSTRSTACPRTPTRCTARATVLRGEWGFDGLVVSDYTAVHGADDARRRRRRAPTPARWRSAPASTWTW